MVDTPHRSGVTPLDTSTPLRLPITMNRRTLTAEEFLEHRSSLPDGGQWAELVRGVPATLSPPDLEHGNIVLNFSKAFAAYVQSTLHGYACFDLGLRVERSPDTVYFPAVSYFTSGPRFAEADNEITDSIPELVIELASTNDRRHQISDRINAYQRHGIGTIWLVDPHQKTVHLCRSGLAGNRRFDQDDQLTGEDVLPGFQYRVADLFKPPDWAE